MKSINFNMEHALKYLDQIKQRLSSKKSVFFLDYDGTLAPIADRPELAVLSSPMRDCLSRLSHKYPVSIISGRQLDDVKNLVALDSIYFAGNHGLEIDHPQVSNFSGTPDMETIMAVQTLAHQLEDELGDIAGLLVENKKLSLSIHYRLVEASAVSRIEACIDEQLKQCPQLQKHHGKKVFEVRPKTAWNKGKALQYLMQQQGFSLDEYVPIYLGDDVTDEDAFRAIKEQGIPILITQHQRESEAGYYLTDPDEVMAFLEFFAK